MQLTMFFILCMVLLVLQLQVTPVLSHGAMIFPNPRGGLRDKVKYIENVVDKEGSTEPDFKLHFPSGEKHNGVGGGLRSQIDEYKRINRNKKWEAFNPSDPSFVWRVGVCGDTKRGPHKNDHLRNGKYYNNAMRAANFTKGQTISLELGFNAHHNGFMELWVCDVSKCRGEISEDCFRKKGQDKACWQLERAANARCDSGYSVHCGPKDLNFPGRWYLPCEQHARKVNGRMRYGYGNIKYKLPPNLECDHCVLHWYWTAANTCNPPGVREYFDGPYGPKNWRNCPGQGGAKGGRTTKGPCGEEFPEEYNLCSDIRIRNRPQRIGGPNNNGGNNGGNLNNGGQNNGGQNSDKNKNGNGK